MSPKVYCLNHHNAAVKSPLTNLYQRLRWLGYLWENQATKQPMQLTVQWLFWPTPYTADNWSMITCVDSRWPITKRVGEHTTRFSKYSLSISASWLSTWSETRYLGYICHCYCYHHYPELIQTEVGALMMLYLSLWLLILGWVEVFDDIVCRDFRGMTQFGFAWHTISNVHFFEWVVIISANCYLGFQCQNKSHSIKDWKLKLH